MPELPYTPKKSMVSHVIGQNGGLVKWDHASMAWMSQEFDSPILHHTSPLDVPVVQLDRMLVS
jgi:hypothetical protein